MHRRLSSFVKNPRPSVVIEASISEEHKDNGDEGDSQSQTSDTEAPDATLAPPTLKVKRVDYYYSRWSKEWKYRVCFHSSKDQPPHSDDSFGAEYELQGCDGETSVQPTGWKY